MNAQEYAEYQKAVERGTAGLTFVSTGACPGCVDCDLSGEPTDHERELASEPFFSWHACDCCGSNLGGNRVPAHGFYHADGADHLVHMDVCEDCDYYLNYGRLDDMTMMEVEQSRQA